MMGHITQTRLLRIATPCGAARVTWLSPCLHVSRVFGLKDVATTAYPLFSCGHDFIGREDTFSIFDLDVLLLPPTLQPHLLSLVCPLMLRIYI